MASSAFDRIMADPHLARARKKLSADEIMTMIRHVWAADEASLPMQLTINGSRRDWDKLTISHEEICGLAGEPEYASVTYSYRVHGHTLSGLTFSGKVISAFPGMEIDCIVTGNA